MKIEEGVDCTLSFSGGRNMVYSFSVIRQVVRVVKVFSQPPPGTWLSLQQPYLAKLLKAAD
jgi:hypothetical protein